MQLQERANAKNTDAFDPIKSTTETTVRTLFPFKLLFSPLKREGEFDPISKWEEAGSLIWESGLGRTSHGWNEGRKRGGWLVRDLAQGKMQIKFYMKFPSEMREGFGGKIADRNWRAFKMFPNYEKDLFSFFSIHFISFFFLFLFSLCLVYFVTFIFIFPKFLLLFSLACFYYWFGLTVQFFFFISFFGKISVRYFFMVLFKFVLLLQVNVLKKIL